MDLPGIHVIVERIPLRNNSKLLQERTYPKVQSEIKKEWDSLKQSTFGEGEDEESIIIASTDQGKLLKSESLKRFKQERASAAVEIDDHPQNEEEQAMYCKYKADL